ncbi:MAG: serine hydrolase [bacterium]|nr:serine hydrolase [bacterium]
MGFRSLRFDQIVTFILVLCSLVLLFKPKTVSTVSEPPQSISLVKAQDVPVVVSEIDIDDNLSASQSTGILPTTAVPMMASVSAQSVYVIDMSSHSVLLAKNPTTQVHPASTTKLMTALVAIEMYDLSQVIPFTATFPSEGTVIGFEVGEQLRVKDLLAALLISSANDAAVALADNYPLGYYGFVAAMNQKAESLHLDATHFSNPAGLDAAEQQSSARDLAVLAEAVLKEPLLAEYVATAKTTITDTSGSKSHLLINTNQLLTALPGVKGLKTGTTPLAGQVLVTLYENDGRSYLIVVLGSQDRYLDTQVIISWLRSHYTWLDVNSGTLN